MPTLGGGPDVADQRHELVSCTMKLLDDLEKKNYNQLNNLAI